MRTLVLLMSAATALAQQPNAFKLKASPKTVVWGYYSATAAPVLRVRSGDTVEMETLITNSRRARAARAAVAEPAPDHCFRAGIGLLKASPKTVVWGYYSATAAPVLRVRSGDTVEMETLITNSPARLEAAGVPPGQIEPALRAIYNEVTDKGPGGHILTGPVYIGRSRTPVTRLKCASKRSGSPFRTLTTDSALAPDFCRMIFLTRGSRSCRWIASA